MKRYQHLVRGLAPAAPPCFATRDMWVEFLVAAAAAQRYPGGEEDPLLIGAGQHVEFNHLMNFCADCSTAFAARMERQGRCQPQHLQQLQSSSSLSTTSANTEVSALP